MKDNFIPEDGILPGEYPETGFPALTPEDRPSENDILPEKEQELLQPDAPTQEREPYSDTLAVLPTQPEEANVSKILSEAADLTIEELEDLMPQPGGAAASAREPLGEESETAGESSSVETNAPSAPVDSEDTTGETKTPEDTLAETEASSAYMDNYPVMPEASETTPTQEASESFDDGGEFRQMFEKKETDRKTEKKERPVRKGRPRRRKGYGLLGIPHLLAVVVWLLLIVAIGVSLGRMIWVCAADVLAFGRESKEVTISVTTEDTMESIASKLYDAGLVRYKDLFLAYADLSNAEEKITTGTFTLNTMYDYHALVNMMSPRSANRVVIEDVLIPEGYNCRQIFALLEDKGICKAEDLENWAANGELDEYWFLEGVQRGDKYCLEGFLFPDTYDFYENSTPKAALEKMLDGFDYRFTEEIYAQLPALNEHLSELMRANGEDEAFIAEHQLDLRGLLTVASLIEEETANNKESFTIASVIYNRLFSWGSNPRFLNIDAAIFYALGEHKESLTAEDLQIDSPYNTYLYTGLVPGPISNPGLASIDAALRPESTGYFYYVLDPAVGEHRFSKTYAEHEKNIADIRGE